MDGDGRVSAVNGMARRWRITQTSSAPRRATKSAVPHLDLDIVRMLVKKSRNEAMETPTEAANEAYFEILPDVTIPDNDPSGVSVELFVPAGNGQVSVASSSVMKICHK